ncbi:hypothetical protein [Paenibacillus polymyxa]|uniref:hypothetical protein n=1 Tax=Paenibacillus polymyxa TaxID=1406 RepID=UPI000845D562|nr:hypothetical protein [Paenibacillus polymyxa]AOK88307.1 hypothetical protein AOU00_00070 [Paenibacillus polymyxa]
MLHLDATLSPSYLVYGSRSERTTTFVLRTDKKRFELQLPMTDEAPIPFRQREERMVVHGGGWGIGTYPQAVRDLLEAVWSWMFWLILTRISSLIHAFAIIGTTPRGVRG